MSKSNVVFIDRDGVINWDPVGDYIKRWKDFRFLPGVIRSLKRLSNSGYKIILISNQAGIGDGVYAEKHLKEITLNMLNRLECNQIKIDSVYYCLHGKHDGCSCRKPQTEMFREASRKLNYSKKNTYYIGDKATDVEAGKRFGLKTIMVLTGHGRKDLALIRPGRKPNKIVPSLKEAVHYLLKAS